MVSDRMLDLDGVDAAIEGVPVLRDVSLSVGEAETVAIIGRNGAGKTTTFRSIIGLLPVVAGTIRYRGEDLSRLGPHERKRRGIGFAPEDRRLIADLTTRENMQLSLWGGGEDLDAQQRFEVVLDLFPAMEDFLDREARYLSGGEQQMATLGRALIADPDLLLLDEPFEGLAPSIQTDLEAGIERIRGMGVSVFIAESQIANVTGVVDRLYAIERGEIIAETDRPESIYDDDSVINVISG